MRKPVALITGANGEIGHGLVDRLHDRNDLDIIAIDLSPLAAEIEHKVAATVVGDIVDRTLFERLVSEFEIHEIYHLAALLSTRAEYTPARAHQVNVDGTLNLLQLAHDQAQWHGNPVRFLFPSSIAAYGFPDRATKERHGRVRETE
ncbi:MAG: NAD-dependent epimerase/dehydratase family protein, partial [Planctomycetes bacterium]|nr:NAD-dependent epimerase/dehydratase family protein [Planctomycetota bacterium]